MPSNLIPEADAFLISQHIDQMPEEKKAQAADVLGRYRRQQDRLGVPLFPNEQRKQWDETKSFLGSFNDLDALDKEDGIYAESERLAPGTGVSLKKQTRLGQFLSRRYGVSSVEALTNPLYKADYANKKGLSSFTDDTLFDKANEDVTQENNTLSFRRDLLNKAYQSAFTTDSTTNAVLAWQNENKEQPGYNGERVSEFMSAHIRARDVMWKVDAEEVVKALATSMQDSTEYGTPGFPVEGKEEAAAKIEQFKRQLLTLDADERALAIQGIAIKAEALGKVEGADKDYIQQGAEGFARLFTDFEGRNREVAISKIDPAAITLGTEEVKTLEQAREILLSRAESAEPIPFLPGRELLGGVKSGRLPTEAEEDLLAQAQAEELRMRDIELEIMSAQEAADPVGLDTAGKVAAGLGTSLGLMAGTLATRGAIVPVWAEAFSANNYRELRRSNPEIPREAAKLTADTAGALEAALELIDIPIASKLLNVRQLVKGGLTKAVATQAALKLGASYAAENVQEAVQDLMLPLMKQALASDVPGVDFSTDLDQWAKGRGIVALTTIPLTMIGAGVATFADYQTGRDLGRLAEVLALKGAKPQLQEAIVSLVQQGKSQEADTLWKAQQENLDSGIADAAALKYTELADTIKQTADARKRAQEKLVSRIDYDGKQWAIKMMDGSTVQADSIQAVDALLNEVGLARRQEEASILIEAAQSGQQLASKDERVQAEVSLRPELFRLMRDGYISVYDPRLGMEVSRMDAAGQVAEANEEAKLLPAGQGGDILGAINGFTEEEAIAKVGNATKSVLRKMSVATPGDGVRPQAITLAHEVVEPIMVQMVRDGRMTEAGMRQAALSLSKFVNPAQIRDSAEKQLAENLHAVAKGEGSWTMLRETVTEFMVRDILGRGKSGIAKPGSFEALIYQATMAAQTKQEAQELTKLGRLLAATRRFLANIFRTVAMVNKARRSGQADDFFAITDAVLGTTEQAQFEQEVKQELVQEIEGLDADPFSVTAPRATPQDVSNVIRLPDGAEMIGPTLFSVTAYHGTPHKVDKFSLEKIGTGEGAQAYGWGLYFAESDEVARTYAKENTAASGYAQMALDFKGSAKEAIQYLKSDSWDQSNQSVQTAIRLLQTTGSSEGNLYTVELLPDKEDFLDWDKPLSEQSEKVKAAIGFDNEAAVKYKEIQARMADLMRETGGLDSEEWDALKQEAQNIRSTKGGTPLREGSDFYRELGDAESASKKLASLGISGIRYLDGSSRGAGEGTHNYVIFDEKLVKIIEENGQKVEESRFTASISPAQDSAYLDAVKAGDMETAQRMVDEAAKAAGYDRMLFHQTHKKNVPKIYAKGFDLNILGARESDNEMPDGVFLKPDETNIRVGAADAKDISQMRLYARLENPLIFNNRKELSEFVQSKNPAFGKTQAEFTKSDKAIVADVDRLEAEAIALPKGKEQDAAWERYFAESDIIFEKGRASLNEIAARARAIATAAVRASADGIIVYNDAGSFGRTTTTVVALNPSQIKSADPVTYDENGQVIPLSQRFNEQSDNINYSISPTSTLESLSSVLRSKLDRNPEKKREYAKEAARRLKAQADKWSTDRWTPKGDLIRPLSEKLNKGELDKEEARRRKALREEKDNIFTGEVEARFQGIEQLDPKLWNHTLASYVFRRAGKGLLRGKIISPQKWRAQQEERVMMGEASTIPGDYDGAQDLPAWLFGGDVDANRVADTIWNDQEQGLLSQRILAENDPNALWAAMADMLSTVEGNREQWKGYSEELREARNNAATQAREEAAAWRAEQEAMQAKNWSPMESLKRDLKAQELMLAAFPSAVREKAGLGWASLAALKSEKSRHKELLKRAEKLADAVESYLRETYREQIEALFNAAAPNKEAGKKPTAKIDATVGDLVEAARASMSLNQDETDGSLAELDTRLASPDITLEDEVRLLAERNLVELFGNSNRITEDTGRKDKNGKPIYRTAYAGADSAQLEAAHDALYTLVEHGLALYRAKTEAIRARREEKRTKFKALTNRKGWDSEADELAKNAAQFGSRAFDWMLDGSSFEQWMFYTFGEKSQLVQDIVDEERRASYQYEDAIQQAQERISDLFTKLAGGYVQGQKLRWEMSRKTVEATTERHGTRQLSQLEAIQALMMWAQEDGKRHMIGKVDENNQPAADAGWHYGQPFIDQLEAALTPEARQVMAFLRAEYNAEHPVLDAYYRERHNIGLPQHANYAPLTVAPQQAKAGQMVDPVSGMSSSSSVLTPGALRSRNKKASAQPDFRDALVTFIGHNKQMEYWKAYYDLATEAQAVFGSLPVRNSIEARGGKQMLAVLDKWLDVFAKGGQVDTAAGLAMAQDISQMQSLGSAMALFGKGSTLLVQATQLGAASVTMPTAAYVKRLGKLLTGNLGWKDAVNSPFIQRRIKSGPPIIRQIMGRLATATEPNQLKELMHRAGQTLSAADGIFTGGTYAIVYDYQLEQAKAMQIVDPEDYAHKETERIVERIAQPTRKATRSIFEVAAVGPGWSTALAFGSEARQKFALFSWAAYNAKKNPAQFAKVAFLAVVLNGIGSHLLKSLWKALIGKDDDEVLSPSTLALAGINGLAGGMPVTKLLFGEDSVLASFGRGKEAIQKIAKGDAEAEDAWQIVQAILAAAGLFNENAASLKVLSQAGHEGSSILLPDKNQNK
jgi:hypothetical protein